MTVLHVFIIKFAYANLSLKTSTTKVLNSVAAIYLSSLWSVRFFSNSLIFVSQFVLLTKLLTLGILFSTAVDAGFAKPLTSEILFSNSALSFWYLVFKTNGLVSRLSTFAVNLLYAVF